MKEETEERLMNIAERIAMDVVARIQFESNHNKDEFQYKKQFILEEVVKILQEKI